MKLANFVQLLRLLVPLIAISMPAISVSGGFALPVEVAGVELTPLQSRIETVGTLRADEAIVLRPELSGRVAGIHFEDGQPVKAGTVLLTLDDAIYKAELADAHARTLLAQSDYKRNQGINKKGLGSSQDLDRARAELLRAQAGEELAQTRLDKLTLRASFDGILGLRQVSPGDFLQAGAAIVELVASDQLKLDFQIPERHAASVRVGQKVNVRVDAWPEQIFTGVLYAVAPQVDENGRSLVLRGRLDNKDHKLLPGQFARVSLLLTSDAKVLMIPEQAIMPEGDDRYVFKLQEGKAIKTKVKTGRREDTLVEILDGLVQGDQVVTSGQIKLQDGAEVQAISAIAREN